MSFGPVALLCTYWAYAEILPMNTDGSVQGMCGSTQFALSRDVPSFADNSCSIRLGTITESS